MAEPLNIGYYTLIHSHDLLVSEIAQNVGEIANVLFQHEFIAEKTYDKVNELNVTKKNKARMIVKEIKVRVKRYPTAFEILLNILSEKCPDLVEALQAEYEKNEVTSQDEYLQSLLRLEMQSGENPIEHNVEESPVLATELPQLPTADGRSTVPDIMENLPTSEAVGIDIKRPASQPEVTSAAAEKEMLRILHDEKYNDAVSFLSNVDSRATDLRSVRDSNGKALLHLACRKNWLDWCLVVKRLVEHYNCDVSAMDLEGNTPLHDAYQYGNKSAVTYLLSLPTCKPDAFNKDGVSVLRMALRVNDKEITRKLLATGRVDPRRGTPRGHTYEELLRMDGLLPQEIDGSAPLQMVSTCAKCIENSSHFHPRFTLYFLMHALYGILENRDQVSIAGIVEGIKQNNLPLPEKEDEIYDLLMEMSEEFEVNVNSGSTSEFLVRAKRYHLPPNNNIPLQNMVQFSFSEQSSQQMIRSHEQRNLNSRVENILGLVEETPRQLLHAHRLSEPPDEPPSYPLYPDPLPSYSESVPNRISDPLYHNEDVIESDSPSVSSNFDENDEPNRHHSDSIHSVFIGLQNSISSDDTQEQNRNLRNLLICIVIICALVLALFFITLAIGVLGQLSINSSFSFIRSTSVVPINRPSVPLVGRVNMQSFANLEYVVNGNNSFPITFYVLQQCSDQDSFLNIEVNETSSITFNSENIRSISGWYFIKDTTLTVTITTDVLPNYPADHCIAFLVIFNDFWKFVNSIANSSLKDRYLFKECITNEQFQVKNLNELHSETYYYFALYSNNSTEVGTFDIHTTGSYLEFNTSKSITSCATSSTATCQFSPDVLSMDDTCLAGFVSPVETFFDASIQPATVNLYTAVNSDSNTALYYYIPLIVSGPICILFIIFMCYLCSRLNTDN